jgi:hypothetical protein
VVRRIRPGYRAWPNPKRLIGGKPMADGPTINDRVMELRLNLNLQAIVEEVALEIDDGKLDSAACCSLP